MSDVERIRLVILGGAGVGKSCIIKRFLLKTYSDKYRPTVEDLYNREYDFGTVTLKHSRSFGVLFSSNATSELSQFRYPLSSSSSFLRPRAQFSVATVSAGLPSSLNSS
ncbi:conserved hypothetical protein [Culex quinquefasciatus]|uniref:MRAS2 n=1 Tax=Culex quinquefasciatus TaxID=7176 RepID=B0XEW7_CULQU|nr:conserved hypothetical protein [Culex quinquefasciatus]|eukprot:XP_001868189.1 conserved hypothetical protein [Culex quinquefasciatus]